MTAPDDGRADRPGPWPGHARPAFAQGLESRVLPRGVALSARFAAPARLGAAIRGVDRA